MPLRHRFSELEVDALTELINVSVSSAATSLSRVVHEEILLSVPAISLVAASDVPDLLHAQADEHIIAVQQDFSGALDGKALLIFPEADSRRLASLIGDTLGLVEETALSWADAVSETGNIVISSCLSALANQLVKNLRVEQPQILEAGVIELVGSSNGAALFIYVNFDVRGRRIKGFVALLLDLLSLDQLHSLVAEYVERSV